MKKKPLISLFLFCFLLINCSGPKESSSSSESNGSANDQEEKEDKVAASPTKEQKERLKNADLSEKFEKKFPDSVKSQRGTKSIQKDRPPLAFHKRTPCYGQCPIYTLRIWPDGTAKLEAGRYVKVDEGKYQGKVSRTKIERIKEKAEQINFFELEKKYDDRGVTDLPSRISKLSYDRKEHRVKNRYKGPDKLKELEKLFGDIVENTGWEALPSDNR